MGANLGARGAISTLASAQRDLITGAVLTGAILLFIWTGGATMQVFVANLAGEDTQLERLMLTALYLNIALILFGWRRYRDLQREVLERAEAEERARELAATDPLTGFLNRRSMGEALSSMVAESNSRGQAIAMLILDLDNFKQVNDMHGHSAGDAVLITSAARIGDIMPRHALTARLGGDEFACAFLFDPAVPDTVDALAEALVNSLTRPIAYQGHELAISASVGITRSDRDSLDADALIRRADIAMYAAKQSGRNRHVWFDAAMERSLQYRNAIESGMRAGIPLGEFIPYYEPQVDLLNGRLNGFEVLARWQSPDLGLVAPETFIPIAEETGMIAELSLSVIRQALLDARGWDPSLTLSVNISPIQFKDPWLSQKIVKLLVETGFPPERLEIELTESSLFENLPLAQAIAASFKNQGIRIALDDFGTGYSSLAHLRALPFDRIKIDRSFVTSMNESTESAAIVQAIARLGESLGLPVVAEGVETAGVQTALQDMGLVKGQGWHFGKPMTIEQARKMLADRNLLLSGTRDTSHNSIAIPEMPRRAAL